MVDYFVYESFYVDDGVMVGVGIKIWYFVYVFGGFVIGKNVSVGQNVMIGFDVSVGDNCKL